MQETRFIVCNDFLDKRPLPITDGCVEKCVTMLQPQLANSATIINLNTQAAPNLDAFDTVILGGSIYAGKTQ